MEFKEINLQPYDSMNDVKRIVEERMEAQQNAIEHWGDDIMIYVRGPLAKKPREEDKNEWDIDSGNDPEQVLGKVYKVENWNTTREKLGIENGSTIEIYGTVKCKSDMPKKCMKVDFDKDAKQEYNYYKCVTCKLKWVCESCMQICHAGKGHDCQIFLENHVPDWGCCY